MLSKDGSGYNATYAAERPVQHSGAIDKPRCPVCGKPGIAYEHLAECAEAAARMDGVRASKRYHGQRHLRERK